MYLENNGNFCYNFNGQRNEKGSESGRVWVAAIRCTEDEGLHAGAVGGKAVRFAHGHFALGERADAAGFGHAQADFAGAGC